MASAAPQSSQSNILTPTPAQTMPQTPETPSVVLNEGLIVEQAADGEWTYDPNEPRYCVCNQVSYGEMVACDNEDVSYFCFILIYYLVFKFYLLIFVSSVLSNGFIILVLV